MNIKRQNPKLVFCPSRSIDDDDDEDSQTDSSQQLVYLLGCNTLLLPFKINTLPLNLNLKFDLYQL